MLQVSVSSASDIFRDMLQMFHIHIAKVDRDVAYIVIVVYVCCELFIPNVSYVFSSLARCCIYFTYYVCKCII
jgi:hypothetical protein